MNFLILGEVFCDQSMLFSFFVRFVFIVYWSSPFIVHVDDFGGYAMTVFVLTVIFISPILNILLNCCIMLVLFAVVIHIRSLSVVVKPVYSRPLVIATVLFSLGLHIAELDVFFSLCALVYATCSCFSKPVGHAQLPCPPSCCLPDFGSRSSKIRLL